ncbi:TetR/AcrR family transcriptional regulator [Streptosporangium sp. NBC_01495]|uniref:TetR/AcrR family transcriptional regulator n=1 Tax=Streptosporangium sp. NBC_01495 TaxID=2903899 RepID=UPI002E2F83CC|nr:TetR/AcrR family transcriptional regulator [Streptosporangium sp. NBC_01495]
MTPAGRKERVDAVRNRETVLAAAARLLDAADDPGEVSMGDIAAAAGVGKGTLFRGFGDRIGLLQALADQRGDRLRTQLAAGESSSDPVERATATLDAILRFKLENRSLMLALENAGSGSPYRSSTYDRWHGHLAEIVAEVHGPDNADYLAHALLAVVRSDLIEHLSDQPPARIRDGIAYLVRVLLSGDAPRRGTP